MTKPTGAARARATHDDVKQICGDLDDDKLNAVLRVSPTVEDLEEAAAWMTGNGDRMSRAGNPLAGIVADVVAILVADEKTKRDLRR